MHLDPIKRPVDFTIRVTPKARPDKGQQSEQTAAKSLPPVSLNDLVSELKQMAETRPDVVEMGRKLAEDPDYPPEDVLDRLADMMADFPEEWGDLPFEEGSNGSKGY